MVTQQPEVTGHKSQVAGHMQSHTQPAAIMLVCTDDLVISAWRYGCTVLCPSYRSVVRVFPHQSTTVMILALLIALQLSIRAFIDLGISKDIAMIDVVGAKIRGAHETQVI